MNIATIVFLGLLTGLHAASWGAYKDSPYEGFRLRSYVRSPLMGALIGLALCLLSPLESTYPVAILIGVMYAVERLTTEAWKAIARNDDQSAYDIPMRLGYRGKPIDNVVIRYGVGAAAATVLILGCWAASAVQGRLELDKWAVVVLGSLGGWLTALGGAWKDAPIEGFGAWKFLRSPVVATAWAVPLSFLTDNWVVLAWSAAGFAVASIETYKTYLSGSQPPGKFATKRIRFHLAATRRRLARIHAAAWIAIALAIATVPEPFWQWSRQGATTAPELAIIMVAAHGTVAATLVMGTTSDDTGAHHPSASDVSDSGRLASQPHAPERQDPVSREETSASPAVAQKR